MYRTWLVVTGVEKRKTHAENCYRRALNVVREMSHPSWRAVELKTSHEFASELISAELYDTAMVEVNKALALLHSLEHPPRCATHRATHPYPAHGCNCPPGQSSACCVPG